MIKVLPRQPFDLSQCARSMVMIMHYRLQVAVLAWVETVTVQFLRRALIGVDQSKADIQTVLYNTV